MSKQTAVQYLQQELDKYILYLEGNHKAEKYEIQELISAFEKAKKLEKQQIADAHGIKTIRTIKQGMDCFKQTTGEQYYNETYNNGTN
jgi:Holliday junction resolvasome RuvABC endonuclease subunit